MVQAGQATSNRQLAEIGADGMQRTNKADRLIGKWRSIHPVEKGPGSSDIDLTFTEENRVRIVAWSTLPFLGKIKTVKGSYRIEGDKIISAAIQGGSSVTFWFEGNHLVIQYADGKIVRFERVSQTPGMR